MCPGNPEARPLHPHRTHYQAGRCIRSPDQSADIQTDQLMVIPDDQKQFGIESIPTGNQSHCKNLKSYQQVKHIFHLLITLNHMLNHLNFK